MCSSGVWMFFCLFFLKYKIGGFGGKTISLKHAYFCPKDPVLQKQKLLDKKGHLINISKEGTATRKDKQRVL